MEVREKQAINTPMRDARGRLLPGSTANPNGRPKGTVSLVTALKQRLADNPKEVDNIIDSLLSMTRLELGAVKEVMDRVDGKVADKHEIEGLGQVQIVFMPASELLANEEETGTTDTG